VPYLEPIQVSSGVDWLIDHIRQRISDPKYVYTAEIMEDAGTASGVPNEVFYTRNMPIASGFPTYMRVGRWFYEEVSSVADAQGKRAYVFSAESGSFMIPDGAILATSGDHVKLSYTWKEEQQYKFTDDELKNFLQAAVVEVQNGYYDFNYTTSGVGASFGMSPEPASTDLASYVFAMYTVYLIKKRLEEEGFENRLAVRDANISIDLSRGLGELVRSSTILYDRFKEVIRELKTKGQEAAFARIDTYSTRPPDAGTGPWSEKWRSAYSEDINFF
jgi:hypothetical protein